MIIQKSSIPYLFTFSLNRPKNNYEINTSKEENKQTHTYKKDTSSGNNENSIITMMMMLMPIIHMRHLYLLRLFGLLLIGCLSVFNL
jgi:hypothetical protein